MNEQSGNTAPVPPSPDDLIGALEYIGLFEDSASGIEKLCRDAAAALRSVAQPTFF